MKFHLSIQPKGSNDKPSENLFYYFESYEELTHFITEHIKYCVVICEYRITTYED